MELSYKTFLQNKIVMVDRRGFDVEDSLLHPDHFPHQKVAIQWALNLGTALIAMSFGLGKTRIQCEIAKQIHTRTGQPFLVICPLGVKHQFQAEDGPALSMNWQYVRTDAEIEAATSPYLITNYERVRDGDITAASIQTIAGVSLDEGSVLRSLGSKTSQTFKTLFADVPYRYVCTATPSPNEYKELIYYAEFLGVMDHGQALTRWFKRDTAKAGHLTIHPLHERDFWMWVASWALFLFKPSDLGFDDTGYDLPELRIHWHRIAVDQTRAFEQTDSRGQHRLLLDAAGGVREASAEKRETLADRVSKMMEIVVQSFCIQTSTTQADNENSERTQQGILSGSPRGTQAEETGLLPFGIQGQDRPRKEERLHGGIPQDLQAETENTGANCREEPEKAGKICNRSGIQGTHETTGERKPDAAPANEKERPSESGVRDHSGRVQYASGETGRGVRNLRQEYDGGEREGETGARSVCGSRSQDGESQGNSLQQLQLRDRSLSRQSSVAPESSRVSDQFIVWCHLNNEQQAVERAFEESGISVSSIFGSLSIDETEDRLFEWKDKRTAALLSKPVMLGSGLNLQQCHNVIFLGVDYKFQDFIQAIHRTYRFQQGHPVDVHILYAESEDSVVDILKQKWEQHNKLVEQMRSIIQKYGLSHEAMKRDLVRSIGVSRREVTGKLFTAINNDCVIETRSLPENSAGLIHTSIPFGNHYEYTAQVEDFGHNPSDAEFWQQMDYLIPELLRILKPGRLAAIHVKDRILYGHQTQSGFMEVAPFSDECVMAFRRHGWLYEGRRTIVTDVVRENASTYRLGWTEMTKDASKMGSGLPEYLLLFRKPPTTADNAYADEPVTHSKTEYTRARWQVDAHSFWRSNGNTPLLPAELYDYEAHVARLEEKDQRNNLPASFFYEPPKSYSQWVWDDVVYMRTLNSEQAQKRRENHICPLPFDIVERTIKLYSGEGDLVMDPFAGLFTVPYTAVKLGRRGLGIELNSEYFDAGVQYCRRIEEQVTAPTLFDLLDAQKPAEDK